MIFRLAITWTALFALIALCNANNAYQQAPNYNDESIFFDNVIPYEKFVEGDSYEPLLYGTYTVTGNLSPYIPINPYTEGYAASSGSSYQTPANSYQAPKPMPANFNVYTAKNPAPVLYKPAKPTYSQPTSYSQPISYAAPAYQAQPDVTYGLNYEHNQTPVFVPSVSYPSTVAYPASAAHPVSYSSPAPNVYSAPSPTAYPATPAYSSLARPGPVSYGSPVPPVPLPVPMIPPSAYPKPPLYTFPVTHEKPSVPKNETETKPSTDGTDKPANSAPILNEKPSVKPPTETPKVPSPEVKPPAAPVSPSPPTEPKPVPLPTPLPTPKAPLKGQPTYPGRANYTNKFTGYRYIAKPYSRRSYDTRSMPLAYNQNYVRNYNPNYYIRSQAHPQQTGPNPYPPSTLNNQNGTKVNDNRRNVAPVERRSSTTYNSVNQYRLAPTSKHPTNTRHANYYANTNYNYNANTAKNYYAAASYPPTSIYNENNVAEVVLRGYSVNADENNNKAIVRIFEEGYNAIYFDFRVCDLKKDHLYSIYVHDYGQISAGCLSTGGQYGAKDTYFNPILGLKTNPSGFLGSFKYNGENLNIQHFSKKLRLVDIIGRSIVIHEVSTNQKVLPEALENNMLNSFSMLLNPLSSPLISSKRVACGIIGRANPYSFLRPPNPNCEIEVPVVEEPPVPEVPVRRGADESLKSEVKDTPKTGQFN